MEAQSDHDRSSPAMNKVVTQITGTGLITTSICSPYTFSQLPTFQFRWSCYRRTYFKTKFTNPYSFGELCNTNVITASKPYNDEII